VIHHSAFFKTMKLPLMKSAAVALTLTSSALSLVSCSTNGDPNTGGIFWNENRAQDRLAEREDKISSLENRTRAAKNNAAERQRRINALR
jgi:hypothetical protein